ncbi:MAG: metallophosphoesterase family protein [Dehalococcoidia bacterium]
MASKNPAVEKVRARRIALISDTHFMKPDGSDVPRALLKALDGVDLILHLGHISSAASMDLLASVAPVLAVQTPLDDQQLGDALDAEQASGRTNGYTRVIEAGGVRIGALHNIASVSPKVVVVDNQRLKFPKASMSEVLRARFGQAVDVVAFANTHVEIVAQREGVLFVNPGSPNLPGGAREGGPGTIAVLDVRGGTMHVEVIEVPKR